MYNFVCRLSLARTWRIYGTFSANPIIFAQLYTIHIKINDEYFPQLWCLLPDKQGAIYMWLFQILKQEAVNRNMPLQPTTIHIDFEMAVVQAVRHFEMAVSGGSLLHRVRLVKGTTYYDICMEYVTYCML